MRSIHISFVLALAGATSYACSSPPEEGGATNVGQQVQAINGTQCDQVVLDARRHYKPTEWSDDQVAFSNGVMAFTIPAEVPVTEGRAGGTGPGSGVNLILSKPGAPDVVCQYVGDGQGTHNGTVYAFDNCSNGAVAGDIAEASNFNLHVQNGDHDYSSTAVRLVIDELRPCDAVTRGEVLFESGNITSAPRTAPYTLSPLGGNGRSCATCHVEDAGRFQLSDTNAEARYQAMISTGIDDPLFRPIDANDFRQNGDSANDYTNLRHGLVRIPFSLPSNVRLVDSSGNVTDETEVDVWRSVPPVFNVAVTGPDGQLPNWPPAPPPTIPRTINGGDGPNARGGYQLDARVSDLNSQAFGAFQGHIQISNAPPDGALSDIAAYERAQTLSEPATLTDDQAAGKAVFQRICSQCHGGSNESTPVASITRYHDIASDCPRPVDPAGRYSFKPCNATTGLAHMQATVRTYEITMNVLVSGVPVARTFRRATSDPGRFLLTGYAGKVAVAGDPAPVTIPAVNDDWQKYDTTQLHGIASTAPYFHNNTASSLQEVVDHYEAFFKRSWYNNQNAGILTTTGPVNGVPNPNRLFGVGSPTCLTTGAGAQAANCPIPFGPGEKAALIAYLSVL